ncbi:platelet-activating factor receptor-like [Paramacrobiotus metropolitanus]|uniref:platelet-activating factor receptor-like n=1 Tax=Paramacrobiotus metropolitanus TaxID=2943436 RepID=UPI0024459BA4|nr:platelet-activating factor receptor-like [Paramacrobiotus metropolitanus]
MENNITTNASYSCPWPEEEVYASQWEYVFIVCYPILLITCTFGNSLNILILGLAKDPQSITVFLLALAVGDLLTLWMQVPQYMFVVTPEIFNVAYIFDYVNDYVQGLYIWLQLTFPTFADWILVVFSVGRVRAVIDPLSYHGPSPARTARIIVVCIFIYAAIINLYKGVTQYYLLATLDIPTFDEESGRPFIRNLPHWLETWNTVNAFYKDVEIMVIFLILLSCNSIIIWAIFKRRRNLQLRATVTDTDRKQTSGKAILVSAVSTYLICMLPEAINEMLGMLARYPYCMYDYRMYNTLWRPAQLLMLVPYSFNFYLYFAFSMKFRTDAKETFKRIVEKCQCCRGGMENGYMPGPRRGSEALSEIFQLDSRRASDALVTIFSAKQQGRQSELGGKVTLSDERSAELQSSQATGETSL